MGSLFFPLFQKGLRIISTEGFSHKHYGYMVKKYGVTATFSSIGTVIGMYKSPDFSPKDFSSIKEFIAGGERVPVAIRHYFEKQLPQGTFAVVYGSTEAGCISAFLRNVDLKAITDNNVGGVKENYQLKVVDFETRKPLGPNEVGEICVKAEFPIAVSLKWIIIESIQMFTFRVFRVIKEYQNCLQIPLRMVFLKLAMLVIWMMMATFMFLDGLLICFLTMGPT